jgi:hypothetical protein
MSIKNVIKLIKMSEINPSDLKVALGDGGCLGCVLIELPRSECMDLCKDACTVCMNAIMVLKNDNK